MQMAIMRSTPKPREQDASPLYILPSTDLSYPIKSILRPLSASTPVLGSRKRADEDDKGGEGPSKRKKAVHFDIGLNLTAGVGDKLVETKKKVRRALEAHSRGDHDLFKELKDRFASDSNPYPTPTSSDEDDYFKPDELVAYVVTITTFAPQLNKSCFALVKAMLGCKFLGRDDNFFRAYVQFLAAIVSVQGSSMYEPVFGMIVGELSSKLLCHVLLLAGR